MKIYISLILNILGYFSTLMIFACSSSLQKEKIEDKNLLISKDYNIFISNFRDELFTHSRYFISKEILKNIDLSIAEEDLYRIIGSNTFTERLTFKKVLAKRLMQYKYIPVSKMIIFSGGNTKVTDYSNFRRYETTERMSITFFSIRIVWFINRYITVISWEQKA